MSILLRTVSSTLACPLSVNSLGFHPSDCKRSPICLRLPTLKRVTLSLSRLPVFSDMRCSTIGGNTSCILLSISAILSAISACKIVACWSSKLKPLRSCLLISICTSCSSCKASSYLPQVSKLLIRSL